MHSRIPNSGQNTVSFLLIGFCFVFFNVRTVSVRALRSGEEYLPHTSVYFLNEGICSFITEGKSK